jgi:hypothetical protein
MSAGARRHAAADLAAIQNDDLLALSGELIGGREAGDARTHHHGVALGILG